MAQIYLYVDKVNEMVALVEQLKGSVMEYDRELMSVKGCALKIDGPVCDLADVIEGLKASSDIQQRKAASLDALARGIVEFADEAARIDEEVADAIRMSMEQFYRDHPHLRPECEKNGWDRFLDTFMTVEEWCREHWKLMVTVAIVLVAIMLIGVSGPLGAMAVGALWGAGIGGAVGGLTALATGGGFLEGIEQGAFSGAIAGILSGGMAWGAAGGVAKAVIPFWKTVGIGAASGAGSSLVADLGDVFIRGADISPGQALCNMALSGGLGAVFGGAGYGASRGLSALRAAFPRGQGANSGIVRFGPPKGAATRENIAHTKAYIRGCNRAYRDGALSETGRVSTKGELGRDASNAARTERGAAAAAGKPYQGHAGHVPDTTWTGTPQPHSWLDLKPSVNLSLGRQAIDYPLGFKPTGFAYESPFFNALDAPSTWTAPWGPAIEGGLDE